MEDEYIRQIQQLSERLIHSHEEAELIDTDRKLRSLVRCRIDELRRSARRRFGRPHEERVASKLLAELDEKKPARKP